jgi:hypothetical protein
MKSAGLRMRAFSIVSAVKAVIAAGVSCSSSARLQAGDEDGVAAGLLVGGDLLLSSVLSGPARPRQAASESEVHQERADSPGHCFLPGRFFF